MSPKETENTGNNFRISLGFQEWETDKVLGELKTAAMDEKCWGEQSALALALLPPLRNSSLLLLLFNSLS